MEPTEADLAKADDLVREIIIGGTSWLYKKATVDHIARALAAAREEGFSAAQSAGASYAAAALKLRGEAAGGIIDCTGPVPVVRKVLGTLPVTADGCVALMPSSVTHPRSKVLGIPVFSDDANKWLGEFDHTGAGEWFYAPLSECLPYSAAEAARPTT